MGRLQDGIVGHLLPKFVVIGNRWSGVKKSDKLAGMLYWPVRVILTPRSSLLDNAHNIKMEEAHKIFVIMPHELLQRYYFCFFQDIVCSLRCIELICEFKKNTS